MKFFKKKISIIAIIVAVLITAYFAAIFITIEVTPGSPSEGLADLTDMPDSRTNDTAFGGIFWTPDIDESLPYHQYKRKSDSIENIRKEREQNNDPFVNGTSFANIGIVSITPFKTTFLKRVNLHQSPLFLQLRDSAHLLAASAYKVHSKDSTAALLKRSKVFADKTADMDARLNREIDSIDNVSAKYFLSLKDYTADFHTKFYTANEKYYLAYPKWDTVVHRGNDSGRHGHYTSREISIRYSVRDKAVLIPISAGVYKALSSTILILPLILLFFSAYFFIGLPIQMLINISRGNAFTEANIRRFNLMALWSLIQFVILVFPGSLLYYALRHKIPPEFTGPSLWVAIFNQIVLLLVAVALFIIGKAFKKGYKLQQDQTLTI